MKLREVSGHAEAKEKGDYWFVSTGTVCFLCPFCGAINAAPNHKVVSRNPLTLDPSLVEHEGHRDHFWVVNGEAK